MQPSQTSQSGNAFFLILIAIFMFAGLSYALMQGSRSSAGSLTTEQARIAAREIVEFSDAMAKAVQTLRLRGCSDTQLSFDGGSLPDTYTNGTAPSDNTCHVFSLSGGKVMNFKPSTESLDSTKSAQARYGSFAVTGSTCIPGIGSDVSAACSGAAARSDLVIIIPWLRKEVCDQINSLSGSTLTSIPQDTASSMNTVFTGTYTGVNAINSAAGDLMLNANSLCYMESTGTSYSYYRVLIAR